MKRTSNDIMTRDHFGKRDATTRSKRCESWQELNHGIRKFMPSKFLQNRSHCHRQLEKRTKSAHENNTFELVRPNESLLVFIKVTERLTQPFAL